MVNSPALAARSAMVFSPNLSALSWLMLRVSLSSAGEDSRIPSEAGSVFVSSALTAAEVGSADLPPR